ncbi:MAG: hypothetical protein R6W81_12950 [Bacteroidales bacterium]
MKKNILIRISFLMVAMLIFATCEKTPMEKAQEGYDASMVIPIVFNATGPALALQTKVYDYKVNYHREGSVWNWSADGATVQSVSADKKTATVLFDQAPASGFAQVKVTETTSGGVTSPEKVFEVKVNPFCPLEIEGFEGAWSGTDGFDFGTHLLPSQVVTSEPSGTTITVTGLNFGWIADKWGEEILDGGTATMTINDNGTVVIANQYYFTTDYDGDPYEYWISGSGTWDNCGTSPTMIIDYVLENVTDGYELPYEYYDFETFTATLVLDDGKGLQAAPAIKTAGLDKKLREFKKSRR